MDKFEDYIKQQFESFSPAPPQSVWKAIRKQIVPWYKTLLFKAAVVILTISSITTAAVLSTRHTQEKKYPAQAISESQLINSPIPARHPAPTEPSQSYSNVTKASRRKSVVIQNKDTASTKVVDNQPAVPRPQDSKTNNQFYYESPFSRGKLNMDVTIYPHSGCEPLTVTFSVRPPRDMDVSWFIDKQTVSESTTFQYTFNKGTHFIQLAVFDNEQTILIYDTITVYPRPSAEFEADRCKAGDTLNLRNLSLNAQTYSWSFGDGKTDTCYTPLHVFSSQGLYNITLIASNKYCSDTVTHLIAIEPGQKDILFPNAFIPDINGPGGGYYNPNKPEANIFHPIVRKPVKTYELKIFDRRGKLIFQTTDINQGWDGYYRNKLVPVGVYIFIAQGTFADGQPFTVKGDITVIYKR